MNTNSPLEMIKNISQMLLPTCKDEQLAHQEAWWILEKLTSKNKVSLLLKKTLELSENQKKKLLSWVKERTIDKKPLQYILGTVPFCNLEIIVEPPTLIPRPETEECCSWLITQIKSVPLEESPHSPKILDIGSGSGAISLALAKALPSINVTGIDIDQKAFYLAKKNKEHNKINNVFFSISDLYKNLEKQKVKFDIIVSNPPYLSNKEWQNLDEQVKRWEDTKALASGESGFEIYEKIIEDAPLFIQKNELFEKYKVPQIVLEIGSWQGEEIKKLLIKNHFCSIVIHKDLEGKDRWVSARLS